MFSLFVSYLWVLMYQSVLVVDVTIQYCALKGF